MSIKNIVTLVIILLAMTLCYTEEEKFVFDGNLENLTPETKYPGENETVSIDKPEFKWELVKYALNYEIQVATNSDFSAIEVNENASTTSFTPSTGLTNGTKYWRIRGTNSTSSSKYSDPIKFSVYLAVDSPRNLSITNISTNGMTINWDPPINTTNLDGYNIYYGTNASPRTTGTKLNTGTISGTTFTTASLTDNTTYYFAVVSIYSGSESLVTSPDESALTLPVQPGVPKNLVASGITKRTINLYWDPATGGSYTVTGYNVYVDTSPNPSSDPANKINGGPITGTSFSVSSLSSNTTYYIEVTAVTDQPGESGPSNEISATTLPAGATVNEAISSLYVFNGSMYVGADNANGAKVYKTADGINYTLVGDFSVFDDDGGSVSNNERVLSMCEYGGELFIGTENTTEGCEVWKTDGLGVPHTWVRVGNNGLGEGSSHIEASAMYSSSISGTSKLYVGTGRASQNTPSYLFTYDGSTWVDIFSSVNQWGDLNYKLTTILEFSGYLYFGFSKEDSSDRAGEVHRYNGTSWDKNGTSDVIDDGSATHCEGFYKPASAPSVDYRDNKEIETIVTFTYDPGGGTKTYLLFGVQNEVSGLEIWRNYAETNPNNDIKFEPIVGNKNYETMAPADQPPWGHSNIERYGGFGNSANDPDNENIEAFIVMGSRLYAATYNDASGTELWRYYYNTSSSDWEWVKINENGFGNSSNINCPAVVSFNGSLYFGLENSTDGATIIKVSE